MHGSRAARPFVTRRNAGAAFQTTVSEPATHPATMQIRLARHTERLGEVVAFYRDGIGLTEIGGFRGHNGYDGVFLSIPGTAAHLELTAARLARRSRTANRCSSSISATRTRYGRSPPASTSSRSPRPTRTGPSTD